MWLDMKQLLLLVFLIFLWQASGGCSVQSARAAYLRGSVGVRCVYELGGRDADIFVVARRGQPTVVQRSLPDLQRLVQPLPVLYHRDRGRGDSDESLDPHRLARTGPL